jgi:capsular polysaccharide biosynthesis protein
MDISLFLLVLWRAKRLMIAGAVLATVLAVLAYGKPSFSGGRPTLTPRSAEVWQSEAQLLIGQSAYPYREPGTEPDGSLGSLSPVYANLANGSVMQAEIRRRLGTRGTVKATEDVDLAASSFLPFVNIVATAPSSAEAARFAQGAASIFEAFVTREQIAQGVPASRRIRLSVVQSGASSKLSEGHKLSIPILVFIAVLMGAVGLVLIKENVRRHATGLAHVASETPSVRPVPSEVDTESDPARARPIGKRDGAPADVRDRLMTGSAEW